MSLPVQLLAGLVAGYVIAMLSVIWHVARTTRPRPQSFSLAANGDDVARILVNLPVLGAGALTELARTVLHSDNSPARDLSAPQLDSLLRTVEAIEYAMGVPPRALGGLETTRRVGAAAAPAKVG